MVKCLSAMLKLKSAAMQGVKLAQNEMALEAMVHTMIVGMARNGDIFKI